MRRTRKRGRKGISLWPLVILAGLILLLGIARYLSLILTVGVVLAGGYGIGHWHARHLAARNRPRSPGGTQPAQNARSLAQQLRHTRGQVETLTGKLADEMARNDRYDHRGQL